MSRYGRCQQEEIAASPEACYAALTDFERLPEWQGAVKCARVLERDDQGRGALIEYEVDARVKTVRYRLRQVHEPPHRLASVYAGGDFRDMTGEWRFEALPGGRTRVQLDLSIDPGRFVPGPVRAVIGDAVMQRALSDLKAHVEAPARAAATR